MLSSVRSRRHRNVQTHDEQKSAQPFFSKSADTPLQRKQEMPFFQRKGIAIGQPSDKYEQEADAVASNVVNKSAEGKPIVQQKEISGIQRLATSKEDEKFSTTDARMAHDKAIQEKPIQRMNDPELEKDKGIQKMEEPDKDENKTSAVQTKAEGNSNIASPQISSKIASSAGKGNAMLPKTQQKMSSSFGTDFSQVRVHNDSEAVSLNKELQAQAFTHGNDIYFNEGKYDPNSDAGKHLLAHELTHVVQQGGGIQRKIDDKHNLTFSKFLGNLILEAAFDWETTISKQKNQRGDHVKFLQEALLSLRFNLPSGADGVYGNETTNAVRKFQQQSNMHPSEQDGIIGSKTIGVLDRSSRNGTVEKDVDESKNDFVIKDEKAKIDDECKGKPKELEPNTPEFIFRTSLIKQAATNAINIIKDVIEKGLNPMKKTKTTDGAFVKLFRYQNNEPLTDTINNVEANYDETTKFLTKLTEDKSPERILGSVCDGGCRAGWPAYHHVKRNDQEIIVGHLVTFCKSFESHAEKDFMLLHESHHAAINGSHDIAYPQSRLINKLNIDLALKNAASFHLYAEHIINPSLPSAQIEPSIKDNNFIIDSTKKEKIDLNIGYLEHWFALIPGDITQIKTILIDAKNDGKYKSKNNELAIESISYWFGVTPPPKLPNEKDIKKAQSIENRANKMETPFSSPLIIMESQTQSSWERGPMQHIQINSQVLDLDNKHLIIALLQELVHATPNISAESEPLYVGIIAQLAEDRGLAPH